MIRSQPSSTLFPYTTLFRSINQSINQTACQASFSLRDCGLRPPHAISASFNQNPTSTPFNRRWGRHPCLPLSWRSEEHTSELQSLTNLVCRLLLEKKNKSIFLPRRPFLIGDHLRRQAHQRRGRRESDSGPHHARTRARPHESRRLPVGGRRTRRRP